MVSLLHNNGASPKCAIVPRGKTRRGVGVIGIDYLYIRLFADVVSTTHLMLLGAEAMIVEGLGLRKIVSGSYNLTCLPMKIAGADRAPVRAILTKG